jgi:hypothetical protein
MTGGAGWTGGAGRERNQSAARTIPSARAKTIPAKNVAAGISTLFWHRSRKRPLPAVTARSRQRSRLSACTSEVDAWAERGNKANGDDDGGDDPWPTSWNGNRRGVWTGGDRVSSEPFRSPGECGFPAERGSGGGHHDQKPSLWIEGSGDTQDDPSGEIRRQAEAPRDDVAPRAAPNERAQLEKTPMDAENICGSSDDRETQSPGPLWSESPDEHGPISEASNA